MDNDKRLSVELAAAKKPMRHPSAPDFPLHHREAKHAHVAAAVYRSHDSAAIRQTRMAHLVLSSENGSPDNSQCQADNEMK